MLSQKGKALKLRGITLLLPLPSPSLRMSHLSDFQGPSLPNLESFLLKEGWSLSQTAWDPLSHWAATSPGAGSGVRQLRPRAIRLGGGSVGESLTLPPDLCPSKRIR